ncbi:MAG TPA: hypothetical protein VGP83_17080 [Pyrinomonadaceae bacterium]|jgi:hypothetical protein|nr:hypothetical protein [Pyrinomonadaceae bacterium]
MTTTNTATIEREIDDFYASALRYGEVIRVSTRRKALEEVLSLARECPTIDTFVVILRDLINQGAVVAPPPPHRPARRHAAR